MTGLETFLGGDQRTKVVSCNPLAPQEPLETLSGTSCPPQPNREGIRTCPVLTGLKAFLGKDQKSKVVSCNPLACTVLFCTVLCCFVLHCTVLNRTKVVIWDNYIDSFKGHHLILEATDLDNLVIN